MESDKTKQKRASNTAERLYRDLELCETICSDKSWRRIADTIAYMHENVRLLTKVNFTFLVYLLEPIVLLRAVIYSRYFSHSTDIFVWEIKRVSFLAMEIL